MVRHIAISREVTKKMSITREKRYGCVKAIAARYDCHPSTVWRMVQRGQLPRPAKIGNLTRWDFAQLDAADANREIASPTRLEDVGAVSRAQLADGTRVYQPVTPQPGEVAGG